MDIKEFLLRKGPAGIPYWGFGLMGAAVVGGVIYLNSTGALSSLLPSTSPVGGGGGGGGSGSIPDVAIPENTAGVTTDLGVPPSSPTVDPLLIGQQSGYTGGIISNPVTSPVGGGGGGVVSSAQWQGLLGTGGGKNTTGRSSGSQIFGGVTPVAPASGVATRSGPPAPAVQHRIVPGQLTKAPPLHLSTPIPTTQTQVVQTVKGRSSGTQTL